ncbi:MAG: GEVED domain-containing protein [Labilibaculum antarcticum]
MGDPSPTTFVQTGDVFYDSGGATGDYSKNEYSTMVFESVPGTVIRVTFSSFDVQDAYKSNGKWGSWNDPDYLRAYDGSSNSFTQLGRYTGTNSPGVLTSSDNSITFTFITSNDKRKSGWKATIEVFYKGEELCIPSVSNYNAGNNEYISNVLIGDINNTSGPLGYADYTDSQSADVQIGTGYLLTVTNGNYDYDTYGVWVDWNQDGDFNDVDEAVVSEFGGAVYTITITPPTYAELGNSRMRIRVNYAETASACENTDWGEVEDYTLNITPDLPDVSLSAGAASINENGGRTTVIVSLDVVLTEDVVVGLSLGGDVSASDYSISSLSVTIPAGNTSASVNFTAVDNDVSDGDKDAIIEIVSVSPNASEKRTQEATITIVDDEEPSEIQIPFEQRTSQYSPEKKIYNVKGDFTMIGNTNLTLRYYRDNRDNSRNNMIYVDADSDASTFNSSSATLDFSTENSAKPACSHIVYAGLYWTGRADSGSLTFNERKNGVWKTFDKRKVLIKHAGESDYLSKMARDEDIYYPNGTESDIYASYVEVTDYVQEHGIGDYFVADMALSEGDGGGTGFCGGWGLVVVYENSKMKWRDVTLYDGYAYVSHSGGGNTSYDFPISGFKAVQSGDVNIKLGLMASEGDVGISGDFIEIQNADRDAWTRLSHDGNTTNNFFNSSIETGDNSRNPNLKNNTGVDISMFDVPNDGNVNIANGQTRTKFKYGTSQDTYAIFALAMAVDAYVPEAEATNAVMTIDGSPIVDGSMVLPGQEIVYQLDIRNRGTEAVNDARLVLPIPYTTEYVNSSAVVSFSPAVNNFYYDPTEGATGSIVWEIGDLPVPPEGPDQILGTLTYTVKVTEDCSILGNPNCDPSVAVGGGGGSSGTGATSGTTIAGFSIIQGYETAGECVGEPIITPIEIQIDAEDYVTTNCNVGEIESEQEYFFCNLGALASIPITEVSGNFPTGCRFYNDYPVIDGITEEFTVSSDFLADEGTEIYYAVPPGYTSCYYTFKITVKNIDSVPTVSDVNYCEDDVAVKLQASASDSAYKLFYYTVAVDGIPQISITPATGLVGEATYYVAEGESASCMSPNRVPVVVTVNLKPNPIGIFFD